MERERAGRAQGRRRTRRMSIYLVRCSRRRPLIWRDPEFIEPETDRVKPVRFDEADNVLDHHVLALLRTDAQIVIENVFEYI